MSFTVAKLKDSISGQLQGLNLDRVKNLNVGLERTARQLLIELDIPEASLQENITIYDGVFDYAGLTNIFGQAVTDVRPQGVSRDATNYAYRVPPEQFDREKNLGTTGTRITFETKNGTAITRIESILPKVKATLDSMSSTTGWTAAGSASGLTEDDVVYYDSPASLRFTLTGASTGTLTKSLTAQDLSDYQNVGVAFLAVRLPDSASTTDLTSVALRLGSSASAYDEVSVTSGFLGAWTAGEWLLLAFDFSAAASTGTPDWTVIDYAYLSFVHAATLTNIRVGGLWLAYPCPVTVLYQSPAIFLPQSGTTPLSTITNDNDTVLLNDAAFAIYELKCAKTIAEQQGGTLANANIAIIDDKLNGNPAIGRSGLLERYSTDNPSRELREVGSWYD